MIVKRTPRRWRRWVGSLSPHASKAELHAALLKLLRGRPNAAA